jgi:hypothetical protein
MRSLNVPFEDKEFDFLIDKKWKLAKSLGKSPNDFTWRSALLLVFEKV